MKPEILGLVACAGLFFAGCEKEQPEAGDKESTEVTEPVEKAEPPQARELFSPGEENLLLAEVAQALPRSARPVVVIRSWPALRRWAGVDEWPEETRRAVSKALVRWSGIDWLDDEALAEAGIDSEKPVAIGRSRGATFVAVHSAEPKKVEESLASPPERQVSPTEGRAVIRIGTFDRSSRPQPGTLADSESYPEVAARLHFGEDVAVYGFGAARDAVIGFSLDEGHALSQLTIPLEEEASWQELLKRSLGAESLEAEPGVEHPRLAAILAVKDAAATVSVDGLRYDGTVALFGAEARRALALERAKNAGILGILTAGGARGKKAEALRKQRKAVEGKLAEARSELAAREQKLGDALRDRLGTAAAFVEVSEEAAILSGGWFLKGNAAEASRAFAEWTLVGTPASALGATVAELEEKLDKLDKSLHRIASSQTFGSLSGNANVYGQLTGDEIGEVFGAGGIGLSGIERKKGGGGTGWGTIGTGGYGTIGKGSGSGGSGSGRGAGTIGRDKAPSVTLKTSQGGPLRRYVRRKLLHVRYCYEKALRKESDLSGTLSVTLEIGEKNAVKARVRGVPSESLKKCVARALGGTAATGDEESATFSIELRPPK